MIPQILEVMMQAIPMVLMTWICLMMICLTILLYAPHHVVLMLMTVSHGLKLKSNAARAS